MGARKWILILLGLIAWLSSAGADYRSKVVDLGRVIYEADQNLLLKKIEAFEDFTKVAVKVYTTFRLHKNYDVEILFKTELNGDNTVVIVVQTGWLSTLTNDYEPGRYKNDLHIDRTENLNKENLLPDYMVEEIRKRMIDRFYDATEDENSKKLYASLNHGVETLAALINGPVGVKGSLIWESLWNRPDPYITPEVAGFIDGCYNTYQAMTELDKSIGDATEIARDFAFNYTFNRDGYRDAVNQLVNEAATDLDTYIKLANAIVAAENKIENIYQGTTMEDRYLRGIIVFEVVSAIFPITKTKAAAKTASGIRGLIEELRAFKLRKAVVKSESEMIGLAKGGVRIPGLGEKLNVSDYATSAKNSVKDLMTPDHIPSYASTKKYMESKLGRELTVDEAKLVRDEGTTLLYETELHQKFSRTYGGRNTADQILSDSKNLFEAANKDLEALRKPLLESGMTTEEINQAFEMVHEMNRRKGIY
jgi:hypothetical protein